MKQERSLVSDRASSSSPLPFPPFRWAFRLPARVFFKFFFEKEKPHTALLLVLEQMSVSGCHAWPEWTCDTLSGMFLLHTRLLLTPLLLTSLPETKGVSEQMLFGGNFALVRAALLPNSGLGGNLELLSPWPDRGRQKHQVVFSFFFQPLRWKIIFRVDEKSGRSVRRERRERFTTGLWPRVEFASGEKKSGNFDSFRHFT